MPVMGKNQWLWIFRTKQDEVLAVIRPSRMKKVLEEILRMDFQGATINDGFSKLPAVTRGAAMLVASPPRGR
jgi:hypothetical protein